MQRRLVPRSKCVMVAAAAVTSLALASAARGATPPVVQPATSSHVVTSGPAKGAIQTNFGPHIWQLTPPADFNAATASSDQLQAYGIPQRPSGGWNLQQWRQLVSHLHFEPAADAMKEWPGLTSAYPWLGDMADGNTFNAVSMYYDEPTIPGSAGWGSCYIDNGLSNYGASFWSGMSNGSGGTPLAQDGTADWVYNNSIYWQDQGWYEVYGDPGNRAYYMTSFSPAFSIPEGHLAVSAVQLDGESNGYWTWTFFLGDGTTGNAVSPVAVTTVNQYSYVDTSAEGIFEQFGGTAGLIQWTNPAEASAAAQVGSTSYEIDPANFGPDFDLITPLNYENGSDTQATTSQDSRGVLYQHWDACK
jgi:hypothetical protein